MSGMVVVVSCRMVDRAVGVVSLSVRGSRTDKVELQPFNPLAVKIQCSFRLSIACAVIITVNRIKRNLSFQPHILLRRGLNLYPFVLR